MAVILTAEVVDGAGLDSSRARPAPPSGGCTVALAGGGSAPLLREPFCL